MAPPSSRHPNLFVVGAMKSGTTSLHAYLHAHPAIFMVPIKEPTHFVDGEELRSVSPIAWRAGYWKDQDRYLQLFEEAGDATIIGESSTCYSKRPRIEGVARRISEFNPDARIVYLMRDPVERTISHYWHQAKWHQENRELTRAIQEEPHYAEVSHYAMQLAPYLDHFGRQRVRALTLEALQADPDRVVQELFAWLGVDASVGVADLERQNETGGTVTAAGRLAFLRRVRRWRYWRRLGPMIPKPVRSLGKALAERKMDRHSVKVERAIEYLRPVQQRQTEELAELLGRQFPEWTTLYDTAPAPRAERDESATIEP